MKSKKHFGLLVAMCLAIVMTVGLTVFASPVSAQTPDGWQIVDGNWYYYVEGEPVKDGIIAIGQKQYYFDKDGVMADAKWVLLEDDWYYAKSGGALCDDEICSIGGVLYSFDSWGRMMEGPCFRSYGEGELYFIGIDGKTTAVNANGWIRLGTLWSYSQNGEVYHEGVYNIGGSYYAFEGDFMVDDDYYYDFDPEQGSAVEYRAKSGGALYVNSWFYDGYYWHYYGADGAVYQEGVYNIGGSWYMFEYGQMKTDFSTAYEDGYFYVAGKDGRLTYTKTAG